MDMLKREIQIPASTDEQSMPVKLTELAELQLVLVAGGIGDAQV